MNAVSPNIRLAYSRAVGTAPKSEIYDLRGIVSRTLGQARAMGRDHLTQTRAAAHAVTSVRPDLKFTDAMVAVGRLQASGVV
ncbi:MAG: hypothetical protein FJX59_06975 [Alphaproteobacteria bacterium]|nr:hypothetical protein [Alphaproteobacteria bacterium]